jgi:MFS family permease
MKRVLPVIIISQFFCTSLWFAGNSIIAEICATLHLEAHFLAHLTSIIQFGFITGTLIFALLAIADRFSPSLVFFISALLAALFNLCISLPFINVPGLLALRFLTGFFLAGIYPVGMKIASDHYRHGLGRSLGFLVGALVLGTALPHLIRNFTADLDWKYVIYGTSALSLAGGLVIFLFVPDGPFRKAAQKQDFTSFISGFSNRPFRAAAFGYFGHMWELYAFWAFVPVMLASYNIRYPEAPVNVSLFSFLIIASGAIACSISGMLSQRIGAKRIAIWSLFASCTCCLSSPLFLFTGSLPITIAFLLLWSLAVIADSPMFSTLIAQNAPAESRGSSLTIVNCIGFAITIASIQLLNYSSLTINNRYQFMLLAPGPALGLIALMKKK